MIVQKSFLKEQDEIKRLLLQFQGFMQNTYLDFASEFTQIKTFIIPQVTFETEDIKNLQINPFLRLGNRLEKFFSFILKQSGKFEILFENLQIIDHKTTLGELDFIVRNLITNEIIHIEMGVKLYLYLPENNNDSEKFVGPNQRDALFFKLHKLRDEQFPLLYHPKTIKILQSKGIDVYEIQQQIFLKVRIYIPKELNEIPSNIKKENIYGYHISLKTFENEVYKNFQYFIPQKNDWIVSPQQGEVWYSFEEVIQKIRKIHESNQSPLIWMKNANVFESFFVVFW